MNPNGLVPLLKDSDETDLLCRIQCHCPLSGGTNTARIGYGLIIRRGVRRARKWMDWANQSVKPGAPRDPDGTGQNPAGKGNASPGGN